MKKVTIYTAADKRPDFIIPQYNSFKKFIKDDYEFVVLNNAIDSKSRRKEISDICLGLGIKCIEVVKDPRFLVIGQQKVFTLFGSYRNANVGTAYPIKWAWEMMCEDNKDNIFVLIDSDMFICKEITFNNEITYSDGSFIIQYRGIDTEGKKAEVTSIWNALCIFDTAKIPKIKEMNWDCGIIKKAYIEGHAVDVGGYIHYWLKENNIKYRDISEYAIHNFKIKENGLIWLEATLNGNYHYSFDYDPNNKTVSNYICHETSWVTGRNVLPHLPENYESILKDKTIKYFEKFIKDKQTYPNPTFLGMIEFESLNTEADPFIINNKAGSGYMRFGDEYGKLKLDFIKKILNI